MADGVRVEVDISDADRELKRLDDLDQDVLFQLEAALTTVFQVTQDNVHIITGSLLASGRMDSTTEGNVWEGEFSFGGVSSGPNNPVEYARQEQRKGGSHDFLEVARHMDGLFEAVVEGHVRGVS